MTMLVRFLLIALLAMSPVLGSAQHDQHALMAGTTSEPAQHSLHVESAPCAGSTASDEAGRSVPGCCLTGMLCSISAELLTRQDAWAYRARFALSSWDMASIASHASHDLDLDTPPPRRLA